VYCYIARERCHPFKSERAAVLPLFAIAANSMPSDGLSPSMHPRPCPPENPVCVALNVAWIRSPVARLLLA
jgi:hypothetical protein